MDVSKGSHIEPFWFDDPERHAIAMRETVETLRLISDEGQVYSGLHLNRDFEEKPPIIRISAWFCATNSPEQKYSAYQYAAAHPDRSVVLIDMPSHGYSDRLTADQRKEIIVKRQLGLLARSQAQAIQGRLPDAEEIIIVGDSLGARVGPDFVQKAGELGMKSLCTVGFDPVGFEKRSSLAVAEAFFIDEPLMKKKKLYRDGENNKLLDQVYESQFKHELIRFGYNGQDYHVYDPFKNDPGLLFFAFARSPLATDTGLASLEQALRQDEDLSATFVVGGLSAICRWRKIEPRAVELANQFENRLLWDIWPNDSHGMGLAPQQPRMAAYTKSKLDSLGQNS